MKYAGFVGCSVAGALMVATPALAQQTKKFDIGFTARANYDSNVPRANATVAAIRGLEQEDIILSPSVSVDILQPIGRQSVFLSGLVGYNFYQENDILDREQIALRGGVNGSFSSCVVTVAGEYNRQQSQLEDLSVTVTDNTETVTKASLDAGCGRTVGLGVVSGVSQEWADNSANSRTEADYRRTSGMLGLMYKRPTFGELTLFGQYSTTDYPNRPVARPGGGFEDDGYEVYGGGVRYARKIGARLQGDVSIGYSSVRPTTEVGEDFDGVTYEASLTFRPTSRLQALASFIREVEPSNRVQTSYAVQDTYSLQADYKIGSRLNFQLGGSYADSNYEQSGTVVNPLFITDERIRAIFTSLRFKVSDRLAVTVDATQEERDANVHGFDYTSNRVGISVVGTY